MLSGQQIFEEGIVSPREPAAIQPASVDLTLSGDWFYRLRPGTVSIARDTPSYEWDASLMLKPGEFALAATEEWVDIPPEFVGRVEGKALSLDTEVPTPTGFTTMGMLQVGDTVFGVDGAPTKVLAATPPMYGRACYELTFSCGETVVADGDHLWEVTTKRDRKAGKPPRLVRTSEMAGNLKSGKEWNYQVRLAGAAHHQPSELPIDPYVLGAWLGDGSTNSSRFYSADQEVVREIGKHYPVKKVAGKYTWNIGATGTRSVKGVQGFAPNGSFQEKLRNLGVLGYKHIPHAYLYGGVEQRTALLQGLLDTDGHCTKSGQVEFANTNVDLAMGVHILAASLGFRPYFYEDRATLYGKDCGPAYRVVFRPRTPVFRLSRKADRQRTDSSTAHLFRTIRKVRAVNSVPVRCISVEAADGLFLVTRSYIPTHNSSLARMGLIVHTTAGFIDPGFHGKITLELCNVGPCSLVLEPGMYICQLSVMRMERVDGVYKGKYQGARGVEGAKLG